MSTTGETAEVQSALNIKLLGTYRNKAGRNLRRFLWMSCTYDYAPWLEEEPVESVEWYSRTGMGLLAVVLVAIGIWAAIVFLPTIPILSILFVILIGGFGVFIGYKQRKIYQVMICGFWIASWGYPFGMLFLLRVDMANAFYTDFMFPIVFPIIILVTLPFAWFWGWKHPRGTFSPFKHAVITHVICVLIIAPMIFSVFYDYNVRFDKSLPETINVKVVGGYVSDDAGPSLEVKRQDENSTFHVSVTYPFYDKHGVGSLFDVTVRRGTLGYQWVEGYK